MSVQQDRVSRLKMPDLMGEYFHTAPVPIRLSCRYSNGTVVSYAALAISYHDSTLHVHSSENFQKSEKLQVSAPFIEGVAPCCVVGAGRRQKQSQYYELDLKLLKKPAIVVAPEKVEAPHLDIPKEVGLAGLELATRLAINGTPPFSQVLREFPTEKRPLLLAITAPAIALLLQEKNLLDLRRLFDGI